MDHISTGSYPVKKRVPQKMRGGGSDDSRKGGGYFPGRDPKAKVCRRSLRNKVQ